MEHEIPFEKAGQDHFQWKKGVFPQPSQVLEAAIQKIEPDGSVRYFDEDTGEWHQHKSLDRLKLTILFSGEYNKHMLQVARTIYGYVIEISLSPIEQRERYLEDLASYLSNYQLEPQFLEEAVSLVEITDSGALIEPYLI